MVGDELLALSESPLYVYRTTKNFLPVLGEGSYDSKIMFVGEAPGKNEAKTGRTFCGAAGKILDELFADVGIQRSSVYITNIVKDRPPENRDPLPTEISVYGPLLDRQIAIIKPRIIATLGRYAMQYILEKFSLGNLGAISDLHGKSFKAVTSYGAVSIFVLYHPAAAIYNQSLKETLKNDFKSLAHEVL